MAHYLMEFGFYALDRRLTLAFPSPFLRSAPTLLTIEAGDPEGPRAWGAEETTSYAESFKEELIHFHDCVCTGRQPVTSASDALRDIALCQAVIGSHRDRMPRDNPTSV
jgi:predicted dehydrogenase